MAARPFLRPSARFAGKDSERVFNAYISAELKK
jgi:hypothetical protein